MRKIRFILMACSIFLSILIPIHAFASEGDHDSKGEDTHMTMAKDSPSDEVKGDLQNQVEAMAQRLARLERLVPSFTGFMPEFSERFHVLHKAGDNDDWALANHEILELMRLVKLSALIDPEKGKLMEAFMGQPLMDINMAIEHGSGKSFRTALMKTVENCNACHKAAGSPFIQVILDVPDNVSIRHPHLFAKSKVSEMKHTH